MRSSLGYASPLGNSAQDESCVVIYEHSRSVVDVLGGGMGCPLMEKEATSTAFSPVVVQGKRICVRIETGIHARKVHRRPHARERVCWLHQNHLHLLPSQQLFSSKSETTDRNHALGHQRIVARFQSCRHFHFFFYLRIVGHLSSYVV